MNESFLRGGNIGDFAVPDLHGRFLNGARDTLAMLRTENQRAQNQQIERALQQFELLFFLLGKHLT